MMSKVVTSAPPEDMALQHRTCLQAGNCTMQHALAARACKKHAAATLAQPSPAQPSYRLSSL